MKNSFSCTYYSKFAMSAAGYRKQWRRFIMEEIFNRRSIRKFQNKPVEKEKIEKLLRAAMQAPSASNQQPWEFIVVAKKETLKELSHMTPYSKPVEGAPLAFILVANTSNLRHPSFWQQDMSAALENLLLEAVHLNLGAVWMGVATNPAAEKFLNDMYQFPDYIKPFALVAVGYPQDQEHVFVDHYKPDKVHYENWNK